MPKYFGDCSGPTGLLIGRVESPGDAAVSR